MTNTEITNVRTEINALRAAGVTDILVSITHDGEAHWGEAMALEADTMEAEMDKLGYSTQGMLTAEHFEARFN